MRWLGYVIVCSLGLLPLACADAGDTPQIGSARGHFGPSCAGGSPGCSQIGGESHFAVCDHIVVDAEAVECAEAHACKTPIEHLLACCNCDAERFCQMPGLDECPDGPWDFACHAVAVEGLDVPFDCRELDRCDPGMVAHRIACGACSPRYDRPRPTPCPTGGAG